MLKAACMCFQLLGVRLHGRELCVVCDTGLGLCV